ncbi:hypothetical protein BD779DRAFT_949571 [Infundibulicybe gibba]|nr:hypothetical protein BD779DRAFT_1041340 [Infundibulicybe gibba]KAF8893768.1 hypothetical protein BD779DRAFT_949571 [Infundibulicybe gibba]
MTSRQLHIAIVLLLAILTTCFAYVPASPTNSTKDAIAGGLNVTDISKLYLQWHRNGSSADSLRSDIENVSYQLVGNNSNGISKGAVVHFSEIYVNSSTPPTSTPWIAMVSCDYNATNASQEEDIFTLARDKGAVAALLYSLYSVACVINPAYADPSNFDQVFDIFSTQSLTSAHLIEYQFGQFGSLNESIYGAYDSKRLNDSGSIINSSIVNGYPVAPGYLYGVFRAYNATLETTNATGVGDNGNSSNPTKSGSPNTALAMIILYAITGCVSALFCIVIISGAIRAIRHPERYGPRARDGVDGDGTGQSRARGLTRAIVDTFPIVKFGRTNPGVDNGLKRDMDVESQGIDSHVVSMEMKETQNHGESGHADRANPHNTLALSGDPHENVITPLPIDNQATGVGEPPDAVEPSAPGNQHVETDLGEGTSRGPQPDSSQRDDVVPDSIGRETCPICIVDFEEGDDLRLLPCEGKHRFHQECVDPWLLELSSSCPICRHDFLALETLISGESEEGGYRFSRGGTPNPQGNRFSRYLRFATRRRNRQNQVDPTDPYMPTARVTSMYEEAE